MKLNTALSVLAVAGFAGGAMANDPATESASTAQADKTKLASKLADKDIYSSDRTRIGEVQDFVIDESGQITHAVVSYGGTFGIGAEQTLVPWDVLSSSMQGEQIVLDRSQLEGAPEVTDEELLAGNWHMEIDQHWQQGTDDAMRTAEAGSAATESETATASESTAAAGTGETDTSEARTPVMAESGEETQPAMGSHPALDDEREETESGSQNESEQSESETETETETGTSPY